MKLLNISITNYRAIKRTQEFNFGNHFVLIGSDVELKSTVLSGIETALSCLASCNMYVWDVDFPSSLKGRKTEEETKFHLELKLDAADEAELKSLTNLAFKDKLVFDISINNNNIPSITVSKDGKTSPTLNNKLPRIQTYVSENIPCIYVSSFDNDSINEGIDKVVELNMKKALTSDEYSKALETVKSLAQNAFDEISKSVVGSVNNLTSFSLGYNYLAPVLNVEANGSILSRNGSQNDMKLSILVSLFNKLEKGILLLDEPETHLSEASLLKLAAQINNSDKQILIATQKYNFINLSDISSNMIISDKIIQPQKISELKEAMFVDLTDDFVNYQAVILVQKEIDRSILEAYIKNNFQFTEVGQGIKNKKIGIIVVDSASKLVPYILKAKKMLVKPYVIFDNTQSARNNADSLLKQGYLTNDETVFALCNGPDNDAEMIDLISPMVYFKLIQDKYNINLKTSKVKNTSFSAKVEASYKEMNKKLMPRVLNEMKQEIISSIIEECSTDTFPDQRGKWLAELFNKINNNL